ncbi:hypothetical protein [Polaromonas sp.]|uniref:hypothetical protein n=1 Tax=Polaromonas sp. TaxID=1869339 RepID=UPI002486D3BF|nr:hypothetical protein [Polaromonas sp.]MDI1271956.1 hypothetical protein [Polaromonas sp.]
MGATPISATQLHVCLYLANTLASLFDVHRVRGRVLKRGEFPFYPDVQQEIDKLSFNGVLKIESVDFGAKGQMTPHLGLGPKGLEIYRLLLNGSPDASRLARLFRELVAASFGKFLFANSAIGPIDANYGSNLVLEGEVVDFSEWTDENKNMEVARYLLNRLKDMRPQADRDGIRLYCDYLDKALALAA